jgi:signal transduction histidine kinase
MTRTSWRGYLVGGAVLLGLHQIVPGFARTVVFGLGSVAALAVLLFGVWRHRPPARLPWLLLAAGTILFLIGDGVFSTLETVGDPLVPFPSPADLLYLAGYPFIGAGLGILVARRTRGSERGWLIDAAVLAMGVGLAIWVVVMEPFRSATGVSELSRTIALLYPLLDLIVLALAGGLVLAPGRAATADRLLLGGFAVLLAADTAYAVEQLGGTYRSPELVDALWLASYLLVGAAALHPSMVRVGRPSAQRVLAISRRRLMALGGISLLAPAVLALEATSGTGTGVALVATCTAAVSVLVLVRMAGLVNELRQAQEQRGRLLNRTVQAREEERRSLAAELHDGPIQRLTFLNIDLELARRGIMRGAVDTGRETLERVQVRLAEEIGELRRVMVTLRPPLLDEVGLSAALRDHVADFAARTGVRTDLDTDVTVRLDPGIETVLYRVSQEALINVHKHARAGRCNLSIKASEAAIELRISDDGAGFDPAAAAGPERGHYGLVGMRERVEMAGGRVEVTAAPGAGVTVLVMFPGPDAAPLTGPMPAVAPVRPMSGQPAPGQAGQ